MFVVGTCFCSGGAWVQVVLGLGGAWRSLTVGWCFCFGCASDVSYCAMFFAVPLRGPYFPAEESRQRRCAWSLPCMILVKQRTKWLGVALRPEVVCAFCVGSLRMRSGSVPNW